jgi:hypothetical protein
MSLTNTCGCSRATYDLVLVHGIPGPILATMVSHLGQPLGPRLGIEPPDVNFKTMGCKLFHNLEYITIHLLPAFLLGWLVSVIEV